MLKDFCALLMPDREEFSVSYSSFNVSNLTSNFIAGESKKLTQYLKLKRLIGRQHLDITLTRYCSLLF